MYLCIYISLKKLFFPSVNNSNNKPNVTCGVIFISKDTFVKPLDTTQTLRYCKPLYFLHTSKCLLVIDFNVTLVSRTRCSNTTFID